MQLVTLGDLALDVVVSLEAPLVPGDDRPALTAIGAGGQAANVAAWAAALGAEARLVGKRGADLVAGLLAEQLRARGVELAGPCEGRSAVVVSFSGQGERSLASDRGSAAWLRPEELDPAWFACDRFYLSGYALAAEPVASAASRGVALARAAGATLCLDLSSFTLFDSGFRERVRRLSPELVFATEAEAERFGPLETRWLLKRGPLGLSLDGVDHPAAETELCDTTGAGDALAAGYLVGGVPLALAAAARCCARLGSMP